MIRWIALVLMVLAEPATACETPASLTALRAELLALTNVERTAVGLGTLTRHPSLEAVAQIQACRTADRQDLSHRGSWLAGLGRRLRREGYRYAMAAENLAEGQRSATEVTVGWMASAEHRHNSLEVRALNVGFGVAIARDGRLHWSMILAAPRTE